jgi:hypothetical protein
MNSRVRGCFGIVENLLRRADLDGPPGIHEGHLRGELAHKTHLVRDDQHRHPSAASSRIVSSTSVTSSGSSAP